MVIIGPQIESEIRIHAVLNGWLNFENVLLQIAIPRFVPLRLILAIRVSGQTPFVGQSQVLPDFEPVFPAFSCRFGADHDFRTDITPPGFENMAHKKFIDGIGAFIVLITELSFITVFSGIPETEIPVRQFIVP